MKLKHDKTLEEVNRAELILNLDVNDEPEEIIFDAPNLKEPKSLELDMNVTKAKYALLLLVIYTSKQRRKNVIEGRKIGLPKSLAGDYTTSLAEALTNPPKKSTGDHWLVDLFGMNPNKVYFEAARRKDDIARFLNNIKLTVYDFKNNEYDVEKLEIIFKDLVRNEHQIAKKVDISVVVKATSEQKSFVIDRDTQSGCLTYDSEIQVAVEPNFSTTLAVFWFSSEGEIYELFPSPEKVLEIPKSTVQPLKIGSKVVIPEDLFLPVESNKGTETCLAVAGTSKFNSSDTELIKAVIKENVSDWAANNTIAKPQPRTLKQGQRKTNRRESELRLAAPRQLNRWELAVLSKMPDKVTSLNFLHIPNR